MKSTLISCVSTLALLLAVSACDSGGSSDDDNGGDNNGLGTYSASVSGDVSRSFSGSAIGAGTVEQGGWGLALGGATGDYVSIIAPTGNRPSTGTHDILPYEEANTATAGEVVALVTIDGGTAYYSTGGTFEVTTSSSSRVAGEFTFTAESLAGGTVTVSGSFNATNVGI